MKSTQGMPVAGDSATGIARSVARLVWWVTGWKMGTPSRKVTVKPSTHPLESPTANALREAFTKAALDVALVGATEGPSIVQYELKLGPTGSVKKLEGAIKELAYAVGSEHLRIVSPLRKQIIGLEVPRENRAIVTLDQVLAGAAESHPLLVGLGLDLDGSSVMCRLDKMPHLLIGGTTGSGKSSCLNAILVSLIRRNTPRDLRLLLIDPKKVELGGYASLPHLVRPIVTDSAESVRALEWVCEEMDRRYASLSAAGVRTRDAYNEKNTDSPMPYLVVVIDELAELMLASEKEVESYIVRITQLARACGIHMIVATQRPSVDVITGLIKSNMPSRLAFAVASGVDSKVLLDTPGAETLLGFGDGLYSPIGARSPKRLQGALVEDAEVAANVRAASAGHEVEYAPLPEKPKTRDPEIERAIAIVLRNCSGSTALLQKEMRIGHPRASALMGELEKLGIVGPARKGKDRLVLAECEE